MPPCLCYVFDCQCTATCGGGVQKRSSTCVDSRGSELSESYCSAKDRLLERECNADPCPVWKVHDWTAVSGNCVGVTDLKQLKMRGFFCEA
ncbi:hypothetical protein DPMN_017481 [Dreissena polymorpha]|uniref:Uncharacterized protein n=1 Tax=Dreissena polymorpha TaxID=45954 RepID=A0A9D4NGK6_DREPO|nr:hypothetical protein DPMN_017481 [Dreissena polymorpha]